MAKVRKTELDIDIVSAPEEKEPAAKSPKETKPEAILPLKKYPTKKIVLIAIISLAVIIILGLIGLAAYKVYHFAVHKQPTKKEVIVKEKPPVELNLFITTLAPFFLPIIDEKGEERFLKVALGLDMSSQELTKEIARNFVLIRENIYLLLTEKKIAAIRSAQGRETLATEIKNIINMVLQRGKVNNIYFVELVVI